MEPEMITLEYDVITKKLTDLQADLNFRMNTFERALNELTENKSDLTNIKNFIDKFKIELEETKSTLDQVKSDQDLDVKFVDRTNNLMKDEMATCKTRLTAVEDNLETIKLTLETIKDKQDRIQKDLNTLRDSNQRDSAAIRSKFGEIELALIAQKK